MATPAKTVDYNEYTALNIHEERREYFAAMALPWALAEAMTMATKEASPCPTAARLAIEAADALIAELKSTSTPHDIASGEIGGKP